MQCVTTVELVPYDVPMTQVIPRAITEWIPCTVMARVPEQTTVVVPTVRCRPVTETVTRQVTACVPYQVPVTVMTTQVRPVAHQVPVTRNVMVPMTVPAPSGQTATPQSPAGR